MKDAETLKTFILEAEAVNDSWRSDSKDWLKLYRGDQWVEGDKSLLESQDRPALTFNIIRPLVRLLTGLERKSRYDIKILPVGEGTDHAVSRLLTLQVKDVESYNSAPYVYSEAYRMGLITGRGWVKTDVSYDRSLSGEITIENIDPYEMFVDPYAQRYDLGDSRYIYRELFLTRDQVLEMYPNFKRKMNKLEEAPPEYGDTISQQRDTYKLYEIWYKELNKMSYIYDKNTGDLELIPQEQVAEMREQALDDETTDIIEYTRPEIFYAVISSDTIIEQGKSPYAHNMFPYTPFFPEFIPRYGSEKPRWHSLVTDLVDPQREKNKRASQYLDILIRFINTGWIYEKGSIVNEEDMDDAGKVPSWRIITEADRKDAVEQVPGAAPNEALLRLSMMYDQEIKNISGIHPAMVGQEESSRESGRTVMLRQQQGHAMLAPYQDNMRWTRYIVAKQILALIQQITPVNKMVRLAIDAVGAEQITTRPEELQKLQLMTMLKMDPHIPRYDIKISDMPSTPTTRQAEFVEMMEMMKQGVIPPTPGIVKLLIKSSDIAMKDELLSIIEQEMQQAQQQAEQDRIQNAILGKG